MDQPPPPPPDDPATAAGRPPVPRATPIDPGAAPLLRHPDLVHAIWQQAADALVLSDAAGIVLAANDAYLRLCGYAADAVVGHSLALIVPPAQRAQAVAAYHQVFARATTVPAVASVIQRADGTERVVESGMDVLRANGQPVAILSTLRDITGRTRSDAQVQALMLDQVSDAVIAIDAQQVITYFNRAAERQYGIPATAALGRPLTEVYAYHWLQPEDEAAATDALARTGVWRGENLHVRPDGTTLQVESVVSVLPGAAGAPRGLLAVIRDITARTQAEAALRASEERLRVVLESVQDYAIFTLDPAGRVTSWNEGAHRLKGYTAAEILGQPVTRFYTAEDVAAGAPAHGMQTALRTGRLEDERWRVRKDGSRFWANEIITPLIAADGTHLGFTKISRDLTARKQAEDAVARALAEAQAARAEAEAALRTREQFVSIASHELRTPLTALIGYAHLLPHVATQGSDAITALSERITHQARRLDTLVGQLLDVSRLEQGRFVLEREPLDLAVLVAEVVDAFGVALPAADAYLITFERPDVPVPLEADGARLEQVLVNLLSNAVKYSRPGSPITVTLAVADGQAWLAVADQGIGMSPTAQARVCEPFYRAANVPAGSSGFGIGLYVVQQIVGRHGGTIAVESTEGQGTTVRVCLPLLVTTPT